MAATEAEECVWVLDPCPQVEGANYDWFVLAAGRGGDIRTVATSGPWYGVASRTFGL